MKKCIIMFALLIATLLIAAWSNKNRPIVTKHTIASNVDTSAGKLLAQDITQKKRKRK